MVPRTVLQNVVAAGLGDGKHGKEEQASEIPTPSERDYCRAKASSQSNTRKYVSAVIAGDF